jgi:hypothetical protein
VSRYDARYRQLWVLLGDVSERRRLPGDDNIIGFVIDELEHETLTIGCVKAKVTIAFAFQRGSAGGQTVEV